VRRAVWLERAIVHEKLTGEWPGVVGVRWVHLAMRSQTSSTVGRPADEGLVRAIGVRGPKPGDFDIVHHMAADSKGNLYTAEIVTNRRAQRFVLTGAR